MGVFHFLGRLLLVVINLILVLVSLTLVVLGFLVKFSGDTFKTFTDPILKQISSSVDDNFGNSAFQTDDFSLEALFGTTATILIIMGFILLLISFFGAFGACCDIKCMLLIYALILIVLVIAQITFAVLLLRYPDVLKGAMKSPLKKVLKNFQGLNGTNVESLAWNFAMIKFSCCGLEGSEDFKRGDSSWFGEDKSDWKTPFACCKTLSGDTVCAKANGNDATQNNYNKGCIDEIWTSLIENNASYTKISVASILIFQILMIVFALILYCQDNNKVSPTRGNQGGHRRRNNRAAW